MATLITSPSSTPTSTPTSLSFNLCKDDDDEYQLLLINLKKCKGNLQKKIDCLSEIQQFVLNIPVDQIHSTIEIKAIVSNQVNNLINHKSANRTVLQLLMINIYNCIIKLTELLDRNESKLIFKYIEDLKKSNYDSLMSILKFQLSKADNTHGIKIYSILLIFEYMGVSDLQEVIFNDADLFDKILTNLIANYDILLEKKSTQQVTKEIFNYVFKYIRVTKKNLNVPLIRDLILKSIQHPLFQMDILTLVSKLYQMDKISLILDQENSILKYIHCTLLKGLDNDKLEIICNLFFATSFKNNTNELKLIISSGISNNLSKMLLNLLNLNSAGNFDENNIQSKFILMNVLSKLLFVSKSAINSKNSIALLDKIIKNLQCCNDLKFQQISMFFLNNLISKNIAISSFSNHLYTNKLNNILDIFHSYLTKFETYTNSCSSKDNMTKQRIQVINKIDQIKSSIFQVYYLLIKNGSQFDKFQIMQYNVLNFFIKTLSIRSEDASSLLTNLALLSIYYMVDEYLWIINNDKCIIKYDDDYNEKIPGVFQLMNLITKLQQEHENKDSKENDNNVLNIKNNCKILLETIQRELDNTDDDT